MSFELCIRRKRQEPCWWVAVGPADATVRPCPAMGARLVSEKLRLETIMYDLVIRNGLVVDGSGEPGYAGDVAVSDGRIIEIGRISGRAQREIDAEGHVVTPGFIDGHTHLDAQMFWDSLGSSSCWQGVTTAVMGNCGFTLAPGSEEQRALVVRNLERAEDISGAAMEAGIKWNWTTFAEYLDVVDGLPKGINYAPQIGHSALRTFAMGEAAFERESNEAELEAMGRELNDALQAGAIGLSTSFSQGHNTSDDRPVASRLASWDEVKYLVMQMRNYRDRMFELAPSDVARFGEIEDRRRFHRKLFDLAQASGATATWGMLPLAAITAEELPLLERAAEAGVKMIGQSHSRGISLLYSFQTNTPYDWLPEWRDIRALPIPDQLAAMRNREIRHAMIESAKNATFGKIVGSDSPRAPDFSKLIVWNSPFPPNRVVQEVADERNCHPIETFIDLAMESNLNQYFYLPGMDWSTTELLRTMRHPQCVMTFSDAGAHVTQQDCSLQTHLLGYWVREQQEFTLEEAVRMITSAAAAAWGFHDRGVIRPGMVADINVIDPATIGPSLPVLREDLPTGAKRLESKATGILATVVSGQVFIERGAHTGALAGQLLRRREMN